MAGLTSSPGIGLAPVPGLLTARACPMIPGGDPPADPVQRAMPQVSRALAAIDPRGCPGGWPR